MSSKVEQTNISQTNPLILGFEDTSNLEKKSDLLSKTFKASWLSVFKIKINFHVS